MFPHDKYIFLPCRILTSPNLELVQNRPPKLSGVKYIDSPKDMKWHFNLVVGNT